MNCPECGSDQVIVANSRPTNKETEIWRRRKCLKCEFIFTTHEKIDLSYIILSKKDGRRVRYSRVKLYSGIYHAIVLGKKVDRGSSAEKAEEIIEIVEEQLIHKKVRGMKTEELSDLVLSVLSKKNPGAYLRYLAYFKNPKNYKEINEMIHNRSKVTSRKSDIMES